ncbi:hypothetical protein [Alkalihalophilus pseudofirmus]|uniref:hypothetical protein n=1 Tax=Alkalihalophilus pseudofirmus TaxID=79885 RepID=UPI00158B0697
MLKDNFGRSALNLAKEILEKEEKDRTEAEIKFLDNLDKIFTHIGREIDVECRNIP